MAVYAPGVPTLEIAYRAPGGSWQLKTLPNITNGVHHGIVDGFPIGSRYGLRSSPEDDALPVSVPTVDFDDDGEQPLLLDPYGRAVDEREGFLTNVRMASGFDWGDDRNPHVPWRNTIIYEAHVRGQSMLHPDIPGELRGTYAGMAHPAMIEHLTGLGITSVQLLPVHFHMDEPHLQNLGMTNYWGYNTAAFFAPHPAYATRAAQKAGPQAVQDEFKGMVKLLHAAGLEVILDVVYNHTAEGGRDGQTLNFRGLGEMQYYRNDGNGRYVDTTGCGNSLNFGHPRVVQLVLDSLRYWVDEFHIDGFRFDLAVTLCRNAANDFDPHHPFLVAIAADPALSSVKLIAEPWDIGYGGWQTGRFPPGWVDWNDHYRDALRSFWLADRAAIDAGGQGGSVGRLADSISGSASLFADSGRTRMASVNLVTAHDGFTLADLVSYDRKHNEANGEQNRDGHGDNRSYNHGFEGRTEDEEILALRAQTSRNLMATLMVSMGIPMITAGDELGRTQQGNNNAYCQDNETSWLDWSNVDEPLLDFTRRLIALRANQPVLRRQRFFAGQVGRGQRRKDVVWLDDAGVEMTEAEWDDQSRRSLAMLLNGDEIPDHTPNGRQIRGDTLLVILHSHHKDMSWNLPRGWGDHWEVLLDTADTAADGPPRMVRSSEAVRVTARSLVVLRRL